MRDRQTIDTRHRVPPPRRRASQSQPRTLIVAVGLFMLMLVVVGALLMTGTGDDDAPEDGNEALLAGGTPSAFEGSQSPSAEMTAAATGTSRGITTPRSAAAAQTATAEATATAEDGDPTAPGEEPTEAASDEEPTDEPTAVDGGEVEEPEPTEEPVIGEFGELPPPQLVSGGLARPLSLQYQLDVSLDIAPATAPVYLLYWTDWTVDGVTTLASSLGIDGAVEEQGGGSFQATGDAGALFISPGVAQYINRETPLDGTLEDDGVLIATARQWLLDYGLIAANLGDGSIVGRDENSERAIVSFKPVEPAPLLAFVPSATVTLGPGGDVREANVRWPDGFSVSEYGLRPIDELWNEVLAGEGAMEADLTQVPGEGPLTGTLTVTSISVAYSYAGSPAGDEYLVPLLVFSGEARLGEIEMTVPVSIYLPAVYGQSAPRG